MVTYFRSSVMKQRLITLYTVCNLVTVPDLQPPYFCHMHVSKANNLFAECIYNIARFLWRLLLFFFNASVTSGLDLWIMD